jgi:hypothetical protein
MSVWRMRQVDGNRLLTPIELRGMTQWQGRNTVFHWSEA